MRAVMPQVLAHRRRLAEQLAPVIRSSRLTVCRTLTLRRVRSTTINDLSRRLAPLGQLAESAGGLFSLRIPGMTRPSASPAQPPLPVPAPEPADRADGCDEDAATKKSAAKKAAAKKSAAKKRRSEGKRGPRKPAASVRRLNAAS